jgi:hypothetical protein
VGVVLYLPVLPAPLYSDDWLLLRVQPAHLVRPFFAGLYYRPVVIATALFDRAMWGGQPLGFNLVNLGLHLANTLLLAEVGGGLAGVLAGLGLLVHPAAVGAVAWVVGRGDLLVCFFFLIPCLLLARRRQGRWSRPLLGSVVLLGMLSKETGYLLPVVLLLLWPGIVPADRERRRRLRDGLWLLGALAVGLLIRLLVFSRFSLGDAVERLGAGRAPLVVLQDLVRYAIWLCGGKAGDPALMVPRLGSGWVLGLLLLLLLSAVLLRRPETRRPWLAAALFLAPAWGITPQTRYAYLPLVCAILTLLASRQRLAGPRSRWAARRGLRRASLVLAGVIPVGLGLQARRKVEAWTLLRHANGHISRLLVDLGGDWPPQTTVFVFGLGQRIPFRRGHFRARMERAALSGMLGRDVVWFDDLDSNAVHPGLRVFVLRGDKIQEIPRGLKRLQRYWSRRIPQNRDVEPTLLSRSGDATVFRLDGPLDRYPYLHLEFEVEEPMGREEPISVLIRWRGSSGALWARQRQTLVRAREVRPGVYSARLALGALCAVQAVECREIMVDLSLARQARPGDLRLWQTAKRERRKRQVFGGGNAGCSSTSGRRRSASAGNVRGSVPWCAP